MARRGWDPKKDSLAKRAAAAAAQKAKDAAAAKIADQKHRAKRAVPNAVRKSVGLRPK